MSDTIISFSVNGRPAWREKHTAPVQDCAAISYIKRNKFIHDITTPQPDYQLISLTVFYQDEVTQNIISICDKCRKSGQQQKIQAHSK